MTIERSRLDYNREKQVLINLILNTQYCEKVLPVIDEEYFKAKYAGILIEWVREYYEIYLVAPKLHINEIFAEHSKHLDPDVLVQVESTLEHLTEIADTEVHNVDYLIDVADNLFREKHLEIQNKAIAEYIKKGDLVNAENAMMEQYHGIEGSSRTFIRFDDDDFMRKVIRNMIQQQDPDEAFFMFSGKLGEFIGPIDRGWFIAYLAPAKRGKTTYMLDAVLDSIRQRHNTIIISLEMSEEQLMQRYALAITGVKPDCKPYTVMVPIMDCELNQTGECEKSECPSTDSVIEEGVLLDYNEYDDWEVCTACRGVFTNGKCEFKPASWKIPVDKETVHEGAYFKKVSKFNKLFGKFGRVIHMPSKTVTVSDIREEVAHLENTQNFIPDVIVLDYADLIKPNGIGEKRHQLDDIWEDLRSWGQEKHVTIISASQTNRISADVAFIRDIHVAEDYSKIAKLDIAIGLCQTDEMKERGIMNINKVAHRHKEYVQSHVCTVLQEMQHQQSSLDSEFTAI
jgi:replicative DNA helicase